MAYARLPDITDAAMRDRLYARLRIMRQEAAELAKLPDGPRRMKGTNRLIAKSARVNIKQLAAHIAAWDDAHPTPKAKGKRSGPSQRLVQDTGKAGKVAARGARQASGKDSPSQ